MIPVTVDKNLQNVTLQQRALIYGKNTIFNKPRFEVNCFI